QADVDVVGHDQRTEVLAETVGGERDFAHLRLHRAYRSARPPRMPFGRNMTTPISSRPIQKYQYCGAMPENWSRATMKIAAPIKPPYSRPAPPSTSITTTSAERPKLIDSSAAVWVVCVSSAPA